MRKHFCLIALFFVLNTFPAHSQDEPRPSGIGLRVNGANYLWDVTDQFNTQDFKFALEAEYVGQLNGPLQIALPLKLGSARFPTDDMGAAEDGGRISLDVLLQVQLLGPDVFVSPFLFAGVGGVLEKARTINFEGPVGLGVNFRLASGAYLSLKGEYRIGLADLRNNIQAGAGLYFLLGKGEASPGETLDSDGDGLPDATDLCPQEAGPPATNGCPDRDQDGIPDGNDECPDQAGLASLGGCPDSDGDGLADHKDACPTQAGPVENQGCPDLDTDGDGVPNAQDDCPELPGPAALRGCPDRDGDGVPDRLDRCPDDPGLTRVDGCPDRDNDGLIDAEDRCPDAAGPATNFGCPELTEEEKEVLTFASKAVQFETGSARLTQESFPVLDQISRIMLRYPDYNLRISGHTDSVGSSGSNQQLSEERAKTCYDYLASQGVPSGRMAFIGYGESAPIADNRYESGRAQNRRVVFELYLRD
jgi:outer membrane protein OmpA-like peptidoglycan-associated protein